MWKILVLAVLMDMILFTSCRDANATCVEERNDNYDCSDAILRAEISLTKLAFQLLSDFLEDRANPKIGAPINAWFSLGITALYSEEDSLKQILNYLNLRSKDEAGCVMKTLLDSVSHDPEDVYFLYSSNFASDIKHYIVESFTRDFKFYVDGKTFNLDFGKPQMSANKINKEVADRTKNYVINPITESSAPKIFNDLAKLVSVSGIYFRSPWKVAFNKSNSFVNNYYDSPDNVIRTQYIFQRAVHKYTCSSKLNAKILQIQMKNNYYNGIFILPNNKKCGLKSVIQKLAKYPQLLQDELRRMKNKLVDVSLPGFNNKSSDVVDVREILMKTGEVDLVYNIKTAQLVDNVKCGKPYNASITTMIQKSRYEIVLDGEEPSNVDESQNTKNVSFYANKPFIFIVMKNNLPLICSFSSTGNVVRA